MTTKRLTSEEIKENAKTKKKLEITHDLLQKIIFKVDDVESLISGKEKISEETRIKVLDASNQLYSLEEIADIYIRDNCTGHAEITDFLTAANKFRVEAIKYITMENNDENTHSLKYDKFENAIENLKTYFSLIEEDQRSVDLPINLKLRFHRFD